METLSFSKRKEILTGIQEIVINSWEEVLACKLDTKSDLDRALKKILKTNRIIEKGEGDIVTDLDFRVNELLISGILKQYDFNIITEENTKKASGAQPNIIDNGRSEFTFIVDPIDGTTNLTIGQPFSTAIALVDSNKNPLLGFVYDPINLQLFHTIGDGKSYLNNSQIYVSKKGPDQLLVIISDGSSDPIKKTKLVIATIKNSKYFRIYGSAQLDLCRVAKGEGEGYLKTKAPDWDVLAGSFIVENAGGKYEITKNSDVIVSNGKQDVHRKLQYIMNLVYDVNSF